MVRDWVVKVDDQGMVVVGDSDKPLDAYVVNADADGSLHLVERLDAEIPDADQPDDGDSMQTQREMDSFLVCPAPESTQQRYEATKIAVTPEQQLEHHPDHLEQPEVRGAWTISSSPSALDYWVIQNRDAQAMFRQGRASGRQHTPA